MSISAITAFGTPLNTCAPVGTPHRLSWQKCPINQSFPSTPKSRLGTRARKVVNNKITCRHCTYSAKANANLPAGGLGQCSLRIVRAREPLINVHFRHHGVRDAPKHVRPCRNAASLVLTKMLYKSELP